MGKREEREEANDGDDNNGDRAGVGRHGLVESLSLKLLWIDRKS